MTLVSINSKIIPFDKVSVSLLDRGFKFGDGVFTTCRVYNGKIYNFANHKERLSSSLYAMRIDGVDLDQILADANNLIVSSNSLNCLLKINITRGNGGIGYLPDSKTEHNIIIQTEELRNVPQKITIGLSKTIKPHDFFLLHHKTMNCLFNVLIKMEAKDLECFDCVVSNSIGHVSQTSSSNIFWIKGKKIFTPSKKCDIVLGTVRKRLMELLQINEVEANVEELLKADEIFLTNSSLGVAVVDQILDTPLQKTVSLEIQKALKSDMEKPSKP